jgi:hypothetical protein
VRDTRIDHVRIIGYQHRDRALVYIARARDDNRRTGRLQVTTVIPVGKKTQVTVSGIRKRRDTGNGDGRVPNQFTTELSRKLSQGSGQYRLLRTMHSRKEVHGQLTCAYSVFFVLN